MALSRLWARLVGLKGWNREVQYLRNVEGDETPAPGVAVKGTVMGEHEPEQLSPEEHKRKYEEWEGLDPGH